MLDISIIITILALHFVGDFMLQSDAIAKNKSKSNIALTQHVLIYTFVLMWTLHPLWAIVNGIAHFIVDYITSRLTSHYWQKGNTHVFFVVIGFDQIMHFIILFTTYLYLT
jgi:hypothetical protein